MAEVAKGIIDIEINTGSAASQLQAFQAQINAFNLALNKGNKQQLQFTTEYSKKLQEAINKTGLFTAETIRLETAAATLDRTLSKGKTSLGQYFSARFNKDGAIAAETMALASERARRLQTQFIATSGAVGGFQDALAVRPLAAFSTEVAVAGQRAEIMSAMFKQGTTQLINFGKNVQWAGRQLMVGFTVPLTIFGAVAGKTFMELEKQVVSFKKVYGDLFTTPAELNQNLEAVKGLASEYTKYGIAVKDTIGLAAQAAAAGRKNADLTDSVSQATRLATLGQMDQNAALETTISLQSAFRLSGQDLADTINFLNMVENQTVVSLQDIAAAIPRVAPVISGLGGDVKDLTVFLAAMQEGGVDAAEGANALKSGLASLINPTKQATEMLSGFGINLEAIIQTNKGDLMATVQSFAQALGTLDKFSRQQALEQVFGKFQYAKLGALFENISREGSQAQQVIATLGYTTEQLASTADKELKTIEESFGVQLTGAVERFKLAIAPIGEIFVKLAIPLVNLATKFAEAFNGLSDGQKRFAAIGAVVIGVVVPAVTMLTGLFLNLVGTLAKMTQGATLFAKGLITGGPIGAMKALTQSSKYLSLAEMDAAMAAQQLAGANEILNATLVEQVGSSNAAAAAIGNLTKAYSAMIATQGAAASRFPEVFGLAGASGEAAKTSQVRVRRIQRRNSGGPIFMSNGTTVPGTGNTDTVPAMLTPGEFVVNKEATKNNLGLLYNINDSKKPQGLNVGGKAKGIQYLMAGKIVKGMFDNIPGGFASLGLSSQIIENVSKIATRKVSKTGLRLPISFRNQIILKRKLKRSGFGGARTPYVPGTRSGSGNKPAIGPAPGVRGYVPYEEPDINRIIGPEFDRFGGESARQDLLLKLKKQPGQDNSSYVFGHAGTPEYYEHARRIGLEMPEGRRAYPRGTVSQLQEKLFNFSNTDIERDLILDVLPKTGAIIPRPANTPMSRGIGASKESFGNPKWYDELELIEFLKQENIPTVKIREIAGRVASNKKKLISKYDTITEVNWGRIQQEAEDAALLYLNSGGQVPGVQYFAANNKQRIVRGVSERISGSLRRRRRPGKEERLSQQAALHQFAFDSRNVRGTPEMDTILDMMSPLTQQTRATRATVLGSTANKELPYAQQKRIVAAIKEGRYEDLFGMNLTFKGGAGSYTTNRNLDFAPFIGDYSNPTLSAFGSGFRQLEVDKRQIDELRKAMKSPEVKKLTPGTAEYARALGMAGWSPARSWRPGANPTIGSDWTFEQVIEHLMISYNKSKTRLKKNFPDRKIQQLLIDEMVGSGVLALDMRRASYKHRVMSDRNNRVKNIRAKEQELLVGDRTSQITGVASDLRTKLPVLITRSGTEAYNNGGMIAKYNKGNIVPGVGNTDTVPAMLTPGEFVVNKEATKNNLGLLHQINGSEKLNKGGMAGVQYLGVGGMIAGLAPMAAGLGASMLPMTMAPEMGMFGQIAASTVAFTAAQKSVKAVLMKFEKVSLKAVDSTGQVGEGFKKLFPHLSKLSPNILKFAAPLTGAGVALAAVGFTLYKLNKSLVNAEKSGAALSDAMYGSAKTTKAMADAFGRETYATTARRKAAERAGGQEITQEAVAASSEFMKSDAAKGIIEDIKLVEKSGENAVLALRNQLASSIVAGVISPEEARAIALDVGKELGSATLGVQVSGELTSLIGPNGEKILDNVIEITAEISPKIDATKIQKDAQGAFDSLNPGEKFVQFFKGGQESFVQTFSIDKISSANASALAKEAEARALLNLAYQEGTITLKEYLDQEGEITSGASERSSFIDNANAQALGFSSTAAMQSKLQEQLANLNVDTTGMSTLEASQAQALGEARARDDSKGKAAYDAIVTKSKEALKQSFVDAGMDESIAKTMTDSMEEGVAQIDPGIFDKFLSGQIPLEGYNVVMNLESTGELTLEDIDRLGKELTALTTIPKIDKVINFETANEEMITEAYDAYIALEEEPEIFKGIRIDDSLATNNMERFGINYEWIMSLPNQEKFIVLTTIERHVKLKEEAIKGDRVDRLALGQSNADMEKLKEETVDLGGNQDFNPSPDGQGGGSAKQTLKEYLAEFKKLTQERQKYLQETIKYLGTAKMEAIALIDQKRYLEAIAMTESKSNKVRKQGKKILAELITLAEQQMDIQRATAFLALSAEEKAILSLEMKGKLLDKNAEKENKALRDKQRQVELNDREIQKISEQEEVVNKAYDSRLEALDKVSEANDRIAERDRSRISLASALASGDIAAAANAASEMQQQEAEYRIEDTRAALEAQRQRDLAPLIAARTTIEEKNKGIQVEIQGIQDALYEIESKRTALAEQRAAAEEKTYLMQQKQTIAALQKQNNLTPEQQNALKVLQEDVAKIENAKNYGGSIKKMAFGGTAYKGSNEPPPALRMNYGSTVPGIGMTDKVPALLTPGEFVVRKSVAKQYGGFLNQLNGQVFPGIGEKNAVPTNNFLDGIGSPRYSIPESSISDIPVNNSSVVSTSSPMYNSTYNVNVNVSGTNASPDDIANVVMAKLSQQNRGNLRSSRY